MYSLLCFTSLPVRLQAVLCSALDQDQVQPLSSRVPLTQSWFSAYPISRELQNSVDLLPPANPNPLKLGCLLQNPWPGFYFWSFCFPALERKVLCQQVSVLLPLQGCLAAPNLKLRTLQSWSTPWPMGSKVRGNYKCYLLRWWIVMGIFFSLLLSVLCVKWAFFS